MMQKPRISKPTADKLNWLHENYSQHRYQSELLDAMEKQFPITRKRLLTVVRIFEGKRENTSSWRAKLPSSLVGDATCYFCKSSVNVVSHHITYTPERTVNLCRSCHTKIHFVMDVYHQSSKLQAEAVLAALTSLKSITPEPLPASDDTRSC